MSGGPIDRARAGSRAAPISTSPTASMHYWGDFGASYCGRRRVQMTTDQAAVKCADCRAAMAADAKAEVGG